MKKLLRLVPIVWILFSYPLISQTNSQIDGDNIYAIALTSGMEEMDRQASHIDDSIPGKNIRTDYRNMIVKKDWIITSHLPSVHKLYRIEYFDEEQLKKQYYKLRLAYPIIRIQPAEIEKGRLAVTITIYWVRHEKGTLNYSLSSWCTTYFRFDCKKNQFTKDEVKLDGI